MTSTRSATATHVKTDVRTLLTSILRALPYLVAFAALVGFVAFLFLDRLTPAYRAETTILVGIGDSNPEVVRNVLGGEIQLIRSPDLARGVVDSLGLAAWPEYRDAMRGRSTLEEILFAIGLARDMGGASVEERILARFDDNLDVHARDGSPVIMIVFHAADPALAARGANAVADAYLALRRSAVLGAGASLEAEIDRLRTTLAEAEASATALRGDIATMPPPLAAAERATLEADLAAARDTARRAANDAAAIRAGLDDGAVSSVAAVIEDSSIRRLLDEQRALRTALAEAMAAIPLGNPRVAELRGRLAEIENEVAAAARRLADSLEAAAAAAQARVANIERRLAEADVSAAAEAELATLEQKVTDTRGLLDAALRRQEALRQNGALPTDVQLISRAAIPSSPDWPDVAPLTALAFLVALLTGIAVVTLRELASGRALRPVPFEPLADLAQPTPAAGRFRRVEEDGVPRAMSDEPTLAPPAADPAEASLGAVADGVAGRRRIVVTLAEGSDADGRPLAAVALARALSGRDRSVVLVDLHADGANSLATGEAADLPGFADLLADAASFAQVIFRDRRSRAHFIPAGVQPVRPEKLSGERLETLLAALDHTYDHVVIDCPDDAIAGIAPGADAALVASEYVNADPRTVRAVAQIAKVSAARILHLLVEPARRPSSPEPEPTAEAA
jgi:uncharacterized protein involved in exopolysaccharide biosynthesis